MKIAVGLSGGVDSSVAALLLKQQGHDVIAIYMQNWHDITGTLHGECEWEEEKVLAEMVAKKIGIPFYFVDLSGIYRKKVVDYMFGEYEKGRTPNPDVMCNREIKFDAFLKYALDLGVDYVATGHYCKKDEFVNKKGEKIYRIIAGDDKNKDQSYFLCQLTQEQIARAVFPIGGIDKPEVRRIAREAGLPSADKKDSQGICFVGKVDLPVFLQQKLKTKEGKVVEILEKDFDKVLSFNNIFSEKTCSNPHTCTGLRENYSDEELKILSTPLRYSKSLGKVIGNHIGVQFYTIGQRHGLNIGGHKDSIFIIASDAASNTIYVGEGQQHPGLYRKAIFLPEEELHWIRRDLEMHNGEKRSYLVRIRYRQPLQKAVLFKKPDGMYIVFDKPQRGVSPGQFAVWYAPEDEEMLGSAPIAF
ncbi:MAG: tRNA 2-thiouridine(34) synthase MnmA [Bacteroidales bacterium]|jgi:tRNA-specific 2-thiouridylase|nr:tRNA 2-thiouridine(34) synthase MnmA [Bacteroidales bacterium]